MKIYLIELHVKIKFVKFEDKFFDTNLWECRFSA